MLEVAPELEQHLQGAVLTVAYLIVLERRDGVTLRYTNHNHDLIIGGETYRAEAGFNPSAVEGDATGSPQNLELESYLSSINSGLISARDILAGKYKGCQVTLMLINYSDLPGMIPSLKAPVLIKAWLGEVTLEGEDAFKFEMLGLSNLLQQNVGYNIEQYCQANLGDSDCKKNLAHFTYQTEVTDVGELNQSCRINLATITSPHTPTPVPQQWLRSGTIFWRWGQNRGARMEVISQVGNNLKLALPLPAPIEVGDQVTVIAGCTKRIKDCHEKFNNIENYFAGFPHLPGRNRVSQGLNDEEEGGGKKG